jgi:asparagine synthase (glutamine-hydrolysing)
MCGLTGYWDGRDRARADDGVLAAMVARIAHRGPDDSGLWSEGGLFLGHRRLAVIDLSAAGHQPMTSGCGRYVIVFNGEIYNHLGLRRTLETAGAAPEWRGHSDVETLLAAIAHWGLEEALSRSIGMFALALWDRGRGVLSLARDRLGEKPLYYGWAGEVFVFGSELKALQAHPDFDAEISRDALVHYLSHAYVPAPFSIWQGVYKLPPASILTIEGRPPVAPPTHPLRAGDAHETIEVRRYWSLADAVEAGARDQITDEAEALARLEEALDQAVRRQMIADVPLGAFLSGGIDSSAIAALMQRNSAAPVRTFTVGFDEVGFDETPHARAVARHLGTAHTEIRVTDTEARGVIPSLPELYDEPFADSSQIPTHLICRAARSEVTVALSGDAGDELFGGYNSYFWHPRVWGKFNWLSFGRRKALGRAIEAVPVAAWDFLGDAVGLVRPKSLAGVSVGDKAHKLASRLKVVRTPADLHLDLVTQWRDPSAMLQRSGSDDGWRSSLFDDPAPGIGVEDVQAEMMFRDSITYLPDDILCKVDRAAMAVALETRLPFLDHAVVELAWRLPMAMKIRGDTSKWALREILYRHVPRALIERPKSGFGIPIGQWLRGPLREWAEALLDLRRIEREGYLNPAPIETAWREHLSGRRDWTIRLWTILMFQAWLEAQKNIAHAPAAECLHRAYEVRG